MSSEEIVRLLNDNAGAISVILSCLSIVFSGVVAVATVVYARLTKRLVIETEKMREAQTEPLIIVRLQFQPGSFPALSMVVQNVGLGPAYNIEFSVPSHISLGREELINMSLFQDGLHYMAPRQELQYFLDFLPLSKKALELASFEIEVSYNSRLGSNYANIYTINISELRDVLTSGNPDIGAIVESLQRIERVIDRVASAWNPSSLWSMPSIRVYLAEDRNRNEYDKVDKNSNSFLYEFITRAVRIMRELLQATINKRL